MGKGLGKIFDAFRSAGVAADATTLATMGVTAVGGAVASPVLLCGAVAIAGLTGWSVYRDWKAGEKIEKLDQIEGWLQDAARRNGRADASLHEILIYALDPDSDAREALPEGVEEDQLAQLLAIIQAEGEDREKQLRKQKTMVESLGGFVSKQFEHISDRLELQDADLSAIRRDARKAVSGTEFLEWLLLDRESPPLHLPNTALDESTRFIYSTRRVRMRGREAELDELSSFLDAEGKFRWAAWTALAGMGKSRLALEFCDRAAEAGWEVGFYDWRVRRAPAWDKWQPRLPTLIVFDYVQENATKISEAIGILASQAEGLGRSVRFLLLERPAPETSAMAAGSWWQTLVDKTHEHDASAIAASCHYHEDGSPQGDPRPRLLEGIDAESVKGVLAEIAGEDGWTPDDAELDRQLAQLEAVSPDRRPLYVALAAEAISVGEMQPNWNAQDLTSYVLRKERGRWRKALEAAGVPPGEHQSWINLSLLATLCGGLSIKGDGPCVFDDEGLARWLPEIERYGDGSTLASFTPGATGETLPKLEPDMLGELFVLEEFRRIPRRDTAMLAAAWRHHASGFFEFLLRAVNSFPQHKKLDPLLRTPDDAAELPGWNPKLLIIAWGSRADRLRALGDTPQGIAATDEIVGLLQPFVRDHPRDEEVRLWLAGGLCNAVAYSGSDFERADALLGELLDLYKIHPEDDGVREQLATGLFNAFNNSEPNSQRADGLLGELRDLYKDHSKDAAVREWLAKAYGASMHNATAAGDATRAADMAEALVPLADAVHSQPNIVPVFKQMFVDALELALQLDDGETGQRLIAASRAVFGGGEIRDTGSMRNPNKSSSGARRTGVHA